MKTTAKKSRGRPPADPEKKLKCRHVVNLSDEQDEAVRRYCEANGVARDTDGIRQLIVKALKAEGLLT